MRSPHLWILIGCLLLAGWALWTAGPFDSAMAKDLRTSSVYADASFHLDTAAAERAIGNRRLAVAFLDTESSDTASRACNDLKRPADGVLLVIVYRDGDDLTDYGCSLLPGADDDANFGNNFVAESEIANGIAGFADQPLTAVKIMAVQYDALADAEIVPHDARAIQASAPRYLLALMALAAVIGGSALIYFLARRAGRKVADTQDAAVAARDQRVALHARLADIAADILQLDEEYPVGSKPSGPNAGRRAAGVKTVRQTQNYRSVAVEYTKVAALVGAEKGDVPVALAERVSSLADRVDALNTR